MLMPLSFTTMRTWHTLSRNISIFRSSNSFKMQSFLYGLLKTGEQSSRMVRSRVTNIWMPSVAGIFEKLYSLEHRVLNTPFWAVNKLSAASFPLPCVSSISKFRIDDFPLPCVPMMPTTKKSEFVSIKCSNPWLTIWKWSDIIGIGFFIADTCECSAIEWLPACCSFASFGVAAVDMNCFVANDLPPTQSLFDNSMGRDAILRAGAAGAATSLSFVFNRIFGLSLACLLEVSSSSFFFANMIGRFGSCSGSFCH